VTAPTVLVYSRTADYLHESIPAAVDALRALAAPEGLAVVATEEPAAFTAEVARGPAAVVFLSTSGEVLETPGQEALKAYVRGGGGFLGIHSATATGPGWPWYQALVGAVFTRHPEEQPGVIVREDAQHPATAGLPGRWLHTDEWYDFAASPRGKVRVLLSVDEASYRGGGMGDHPIAWCHGFEGGRSLYTGVGHSVASWAEPLLLAHVGGALRWVVAR
jgi:type 1 glutamine amidotransferase